MGVAANAALRVSSCLAFIVVRGPLLLAPETGVEPGGVDPFSLSLPGVSESSLLISLVFSTSSVPLSARGVEDLVEFPPCPRPWEGTGVELGEPSFESDSIIFSGLEFSGDGIPGSLNG